MAPQPPHAGEHGHPSIRRSILDGLRFVRSNRALVGSFGIDLAAMTFGMPRTLFPVLSLTVYHAGAAGTGALFAAVSAGATVAALSTGWLAHVRRLGRVVIWAVLAWGAAIALAGARRLAVAGACAVRARRRGRQRQRGVPLDDQPDRHARRDARAHVGRLLARRHERTAPRRHRVGRGRLARDAALLGRSPAASAACSRRRCSRAPSRRSCATTRRMPERALRAANATELEPAAA